MIEDACPLSKQKMHHTIKLNTFDGTYTIELYKTGAKCYTLSQYSSI